MTTTPGSDNARLPVTVVPKHYHVTYEQIDFANFTFTGTVSLQCTAAVTLEKTSLTLHALEVSLLSAVLEKKKSDDDDDDRTVLHAEEFRYQPKNQTVRISFGEDNFLKEGTDYVLEIEFRGILNDQMHGLYRSTYTGVDGKTHIMATTQFEATDARRAFPCFDEPALKATFQVTVTIPANKQVVSNTPIASSHTTGGGDDGTPLMKTITFQETPKMSTYLLALVVGEFDATSATSHGTVTTVYTVPGKADQGQFCLDVAVRCLDLYEKLFGIHYPLTKSDLLAIPDFAAGAMENWGCVTYREAKVLVKPGATSEEMRRSIARTVCHELAHQWFGNLVTMEWWTQLYLNEGMARFMEFVGIDALFPEWNAWTEFVQSVYGMALSLDALKSSHPVEVEVHHPDEINAIFDAISYAKGASIVRMIASYIGMDNFWKGMRTYLTRHAYGNTVTNDLWKALEEASGKPVIEFMHPWTSVTGYPILELTEDGDITMERFLASGPEEGKGTQWPVPVTAKVEGSDEVLGPWVINGPGGDEKAELAHKIKEWSSAGKWFKLNIEQTAFCRVSYSEAQWKRLALVMCPDSPLSTSDLLGLISDSFAAGRSGYASITDSFPLIESFAEHETAEYVVWQELSENLSAIATLFRSEKFYGNVQAFLRKLYSRQVRLLGWTPKPDEAGRTGTLRATVIGMMGMAEDPEVLKQAFDLFMEHKKDPDNSSIPGDLRMTVFQCALRHDEAKVFDALKKIYETTSLPEEQRNCLMVMGSVKDPQRHAGMLDYVYNSGRVRKQDVAFPLGPLAGTSDEGGRAIWEYFKRNYSELHAMLPAGAIWSSCVALSCRGLQTFAEVEEVEEFFRIHSVGSAKQRLTQTLEVLRTRAARRERDHPAMEAYFGA